jgi:lysophospholipase L1-like esterase
MAGLQGVAAPWIFIDNLNSGWRNSVGAQDAGTGQGWQTGTGTVAHPKGDGNGDLYVSADGTHPTEAGSVYLGTRLAETIKAAIEAL